MAYIPKAVRRKYIPKPGSAKERPLGIPCFEDKLVQAGLVRILESVYEQDFIEDSHGFRPARSCHSVLKTLSLTMEYKPINHIVEADIKGFFDNVNQEWLLKFLAHRIGDKRIQRMVKRILKAGVAEGGSVTISDDGTPQGGVLSRCWQISICITPSTSGLKGSTARVAPVMPDSSVMPMILLFL